MEVLILAAGEGKRIEKISNNVPKSLLSVNSNGQSSLSLLLRQFTEISVSKIYISLGFSFDLFVNQLSYIKSQYNKSIPVIPIDARPNYIKGPLFSFLAGKPYLTKSSLFGLFPADTIFSSEFFNAIQFISFEPNILHILYITPSVCPKSGYFLKFSSESHNSHTQKRIEEFISLSSVDTSKFVPHSMGYMLPVLFFPGTIFNFAEKFVDLGKTTVMHIVIEWIKQRKSYTLHHIDISETPFFDIDTPEDFKEIREKFAQV